MTGTTDASPSRSPARILIVDDHPLVREALVRQISKQPGMAVCGQATGVEDGFARVVATAPDLALIDMSLQDGHGLDLIKRVASQFPGIKMLVISTHEEALYADRALRAGAHGYLNKRESPLTVLEAIRHVLQGHRYLSPELNERGVGHAAIDARQPEPSDVGRLSDRELQVFRLIGQGLTTNAIARQLRLSTHTIDTHRENIRSKLNLKSGPELRRLAVKWELANPSG